MTELKKSLIAYAKSIGATGELSSDDLGELKKATRKVADLMSDNEWHFAQEIIDRSGTREGLRRMRELRQHGFTIERRYHDNREYQYRLLPR